MANPIAKPGAGVPRWPATAALIAIAGAFLLISQELVLGSRWLVPGGIAVLIVALVVMRLRQNRTAIRALAILGLGCVTAALCATVGLLLVGVVENSTSAVTLLRDAALIWAANWLTFAIWYWEIDGGGPAVRKRHAHDSDDFAFPQMTAGALADSDWSPDFLDYVYLAFNTSTAFSPTDTLVLSRRAKVLMMAQSLLSLLVLAVLAARALNKL